MRLLDPVAVHVQRARSRSDQERPEARIASIDQGDACALPWQDASLDGCLVFGPMYHLVSREDRAQALAEVRRVLRPGGVVLMTAVSRFASVRGGLVRGYLADPAYQAIVARELIDGQHRNPGADPRWFTAAYYHRPEELVDEVEEAGFVTDALVAVDGVGGFLHNLHWWLDDEERRETLLSAVRDVESEPSLLGASPQFMLVART
jgi:ubiquinone/menaquinone biosynthesis C-methylase UbiE